MIKDGQIKSQVDAYHVGEFVIRYPPIMAFFSKGEQVIIPRAMQPEMLKIIHSSHLGMEKCKRRARDILYWPGMSTQIEDFVPLVVSAVFMLIATPKNHASLTLCLTNHCPKLVVTYLNSKESITSY